MGGASLMATIEERIARIKRAIEAGNDDAITLATRSESQCRRFENSDERRKLQVRCSGWRHTEGTRRRMSAARKGCARPEEVACKISAALQGRSFTEEHKRKLSAAQMGKVHGPMSEETKRQLSMIMAAKVKAGDLRAGENVRGIAGVFQSAKNCKALHYRSQLELRWYERLEMDAAIKRYVPEPFVIPYRFKDAVRSYVPDIFVLYTDGRCELIEIKPERQWQNPINIAKWRYAKAWCSKSIVKVEFKVLGYLALEEVA